MRQLLLLFLVAIGLGEARAHAGMELRTVVGGLSSPLYVASAKDGSGRLFIVEQAGRIRIFSGGGLLSEPFLDIRERVRSGGELGLLGLAFHPQYSQNGRLFINYTRDGPAGLETVIAEYSVSSQNVNLALKTSERILLRYAQPFTNHNGGMLEFGPDGYLYIGTGDGGSGGDPQGNGQSLDALLGKLLRIDVDSGNPYGIPPDNPFVGKAGRDEIWAYGLRNPWRFSFDPLTGRLFAADVGQNRWEEVDLIVKGGNYGWNRMEGAHCFSPMTNCNQDGLILPIHEYGREEGFSITGGYIYRGSDVPSLWGKYLFADFGSGRVWALTERPDGRWQNEELLRTGLPISSFGEDERGEVYVVDYGGSIRQIVSTEPLRPAINAGGVVSAASFLPGSVAPGEIVSLFGLGLGPGRGAEGKVNAVGRVDSTLAETRVLFDGIPAPLFFVRADQINAQVPYEVSGRSSASVQVLFRGASSDAVAVPVAEAAPAIFARFGGTGQGAILNEDSSLNTSSCPARRGSTVSLFATGEGQRTPPGINGELAIAPYPVPLLPVAVRIGGLLAETVFVGAAPGNAGLLQMNVRVPQEVTPGNAVPVFLVIGNTASPAGITMAVN